tara:strand:- start:909 stop:1052 length:144 start_codon:yes stop_codon:yes gene_type:complete
MKAVILKIKYILHRMGLHNDNCRRRLYSTEKDYICMVTGNTHKKFTL